MTRPPQAPAAPQEAEVDAAPPQAPGVRVPTLFVELTGDQACFPEDAVAMVNASLAAAEIGGWLAQRFAQD
ncbi:hypothetical protein CA982_19415 [Gordonia lacunae]|uniref:Uncharacterized protein n=1 Tax=Gordonia lacunae TaxID=417102 RepID=A0A243Q6I3_9ACTN|nr:hypothetical protein CA982_19415 [Gordonia lacunae]